MILFVDDNRARMENAVEELQRRGFEIQLEDTVDGALQFLNKHSNVIEAIICDIMLPHGATLGAEETRDGLRTGVVIFEMIRRKHPEVPIVLFTNLNDEALRARFAAEKRCLYLEKPDYLSSAFADRVRDFLVGET